LQTEDSRARSDAILDDLYRNPGQIRKRGKGKGGGSGFGLQSLILGDGLNKGVIVITVDVGRPILGCTMDDIEKITMSLAKIGVFPDPTSAVARLMSNPSTGKLRDDVLGERFYYIVIQCKTEESKLPDVVRALKEAEKEVDTVFSVAVHTRLSDDYSLPDTSSLEELGVKAWQNGKVWLDLGKPPE